MHTKTVKSRVMNFRTFKYLIPVCVIFISCLDFQFESEYEDINGIYVEYVRYYSFLGTKMLFDNDVGYIASADSLLIYDFTKIDSAIHLGYYNATNSINDFQIYEECIVLVTDQSVEIVDISDSLPHQLSVVSFFLLGNHLKVSNDHAFVASRNRLYVVNISDKQNPILASNIEFHDDIKQVELKEDFAYVLSGTDFNILDIHSPNALDLVSTTSLVPLGILHPRAFADKDNFLYFSSYSIGPATLFACELTESNDVQVLNNIACPGLIHQFHISDEYTLAVHWSEAYLLNLQHPSSPCVGEIIDAGGYWGTIHGNHVCILTPYLLIFEIIQVD